MHDNNDSGIKKVIFEKLLPVAVKAKDKAACVVAACLKWCSGAVSWCKSQADKTNTLIFMWCFAALLSIIVIFISPPVYIEYEPVQLDIRAMASVRFAQNGLVYITGAYELTAKEIESALTVTPNVDFSVRLEPEMYGAAILTMYNARNISYVLSFEFLYIDIETGEEEVRGRFSEMVNGADMTVRISPERGWLEVFDPVTLTFSENVDVDSLRQSIRINPYTEFTLEPDSNRRIVTLRPRDGWEAGARYTISIAETYQSTNGREFAGRQQLTFSVRSIAPPRPFVNFRNIDNYILGTNEGITLFFSAGHLNRSIPVIVETYRMESLERQQRQGHIFLNHGIPLDLLERVDTNVFLVENGDQYFILPNPGEGAYIISITFTHPYSGRQINERVTYLITHMTIYMQSSSRDTLLWINSRETGGPLMGYQIFFEYDTEPAGTTDQNGLAIFNRPRPISDDDENDWWGWPDSHNFRIYNPAGELVYYDRGFAQHDFWNRDRYYSYLFLDRSIYRPDDTIHFWGFVQPYRNNVREMPETVTVTFDAGGLDIVQEITIEPSGVYHGEIQLERVRSSQYPVTVTLRFPPEEEGEPYVTRALDTRFVTVREFQTPAFVISSVVDELFYGARDTVTATATINFFDGTPMAYGTVELSYFQNHSRSWYSLGDAVTDAYGNVTFEFPAWTGTDSVGSGPTTGRYRVRIASEGEDITHIGRYTVFPSDMLFDIRLERQPNGLNLELMIELYRLNLQSPQLRNAFIEGESIWSLHNERLLEIARGERIDAEDIRIGLNWDFIDEHDIRRRYNFNPYWSERHFLFAEGDDYNFNYILEQNPNITIREGAFHNHDNIGSTRRASRRLSVDTANGAVRITNLLYVSRGAIDWERDIFARASISFLDGHGNIRSAWISYPERDFNWDAWWSVHDEVEAIPGYSFEVINLATNENITPAHSWWGNQRLSVNVGDTMRFNLLFNGEPVETEGTILLSLIQDGILEHRFAFGNSFDLQYNIISHGNGFNLVAVYFDGSDTWPVEHMDVFATHASRSLTIEVTPDREEYRPGDTVNLNVRTTDSRGAGVPSNVVVAVVDESIFAVSEQHLWVLSDLHSDLWDINNTVNQYFTSRYAQLNRPPAADEGAGKGGTMAFQDTHRSDFRDTATFLPATTNAAGNASLSFTLPDNTTSWRITSVAIGNNLMAGQSVDNIISTLPFFVRPVITPRHIYGDDFAMIIQSHGAVLGSDSEVTYTVTVIGDNFFATQTVSAMAHRSVELNFGKLPVGQYTVISRAQVGGFADTVEQQVSFVRSNLELIISREIALDETIDIDPTRFPVTMTFYNDAARPFIVSLDALFKHYGGQTAQRLGRVVARRTLRENMPDENVPPHIAATSEFIADLQNIDGGIGSFSGADSNPRTTTYILLLERDQFNLRQMAGYYNWAISNAQRLLREPENSSFEIQRLRMDIAASHLGLAIIGEMDADEILAEIRTTRTTEERAYYIAALAYIGETEAALELYERHLAPHINSIRVRPLIHRRDRDIAAIWIAASLLRHDDADFIALYFGSRRWRSHILYETMIYVYYFDRVIEPSTLSLTTHDQSHDFRFGVETTIRGRVRASFMHSIALSRSRLESLRFTQVPDDIRAIAFYIGSPSELGLEQSDNMSIRQDIRALDHNTYEVTFTIWLSEEAPLGRYDISAWIPSNTRLYSHDSNFSYSAARHDIIRFNTRQELQNLYISFNNNSRLEKTIIYTYRVRRTFSSEAVLDTVYMIHGDTGENANSERDVFSTVR